MILLFAVACTSVGSLVPALVDEDPTLPAVAIEVAGRERLVHLQTFGDPESPTLLMLHGSLADHRAFLPYEVLADRYHVVMWDQRGSGLSERVTADEYTWDSVVEEIDAVKELFSPDDPVTLVGHSFGAMFSALYLSSRPGAVHQAVLLEPAALTGEGFGATAMDITNIDLLASGLNEGFWQSEALSPSGHELADYKALRLLLDGHQTNYHCDPDHPTDLPLWRAGAFAEVRRAANLQISGGGADLHADFDFAFGLRDFDTPVLLVASECSALGTAMQERWNVPLFVEVELVTIPDTGHRMFVEDFDATLAAMREYLEP
ncbi:MAG: alpha/beta hydrolase [Alphaproteobacteria bacterium]|nr:alpha/beta hydrolase [Alphaproteobacteria bacterium]